MDELAKRLKKSREHAGLTQKELADRINQRFCFDLKQQNIQKIERGGSKGGQKGTSYIVHIAYVCNVNPLWLATGIGDMTSANNKITTTEVGADKDELDLLKDYRQMVPSSRTQFRALGKTLREIKTGSSIRDSKINSTNVKLSKRAEKKISNGS